ncbi:hypothetical protein C4D60_Mb04t08780 [Musa balbisiana]|uniref:Uncharacterized protein n=1 Tax=Musa balbisiana TaxID=52838 RepID=A0A4S8KAM7_MUSBA|nr:hypothetical protein C4D60_Mb04t08780 [Musa balbisiana]
MKPDIDRRLGGFGTKKDAVRAFSRSGSSYLELSFGPSQNPNPETLVVAASIDGSIANLSVSLCSLDERRQKQGQKGMEKMFGKNRHEIISTCEDRKYPATFLALMALPFSKAVSGLYVALYWRSHVVSIGTQGLCIWLTPIPYWYKHECKNEIGTHSDLSLRSHISVSIELILNRWNSLLIRLFLFPFALLKVTDIGGHGAGYAYMVFRLQISGHGALGDALALITI